MLLGLALPALGATVNYTLTAKNVRLAIGSGLTYAAWTYDGTVPGPVLRARVGDTVNITLRNDTSISHGIDIHAAQIAPDKHFVPQGNARTVHYTFVPRVPGVFVYHCSAIPIVEHIANGMYGMMVVEPRGGWPDGPAREISIVQGEWYGKPDKKGFVAGDSRAMLAEQPDFVVFNGAIDRYADHPIKVKTGRLVRVYFVNAGPNLMSTFHVIGSIF
ncbi:MAG: multicopper oxidase domain-containing protein, partial [Pseudomonadota bacterium]